MLSLSASMDCQCSLKVKQISKILHEVREVLDQLKLSLRLVAFILKGVSPQARTSAIGKQSSGQLSQALAAMTAIEERRSSQALA